MTPFLWFPASLVSVFIPALTGLVDTADLCVCVCVCMCMCVLCVCVFCLCVCASQVTWTQLDEPLAADLRQACAEVLASLGRSSEKVNVL